MGRSKKKSGASIFILFTPKQTKIKNLEEIKKRIYRVPSNTSINAQLSNSNYPKHLLKFSHLNNVVNASDSDFCDKESIASSKANLNFKKVRTDLFDLATDANQDGLQQKKKKTLVKDEMQNVVSFLMRYLIILTLHNIEACIFSAQYDDVMA